MIILVLFVNRDALAHAPVPKDDILRAPSKVVWVPTTFLEEVLVLEGNDAAKIDPVLADDMPDCVFGRT